MKNLLALSVIGMMCVPAVLAQTNVLEQGSMVSISVNDDRSGTIQNAFTTALSAAGFKIDNNNYGYQLDVNITVTPQTNQNQNLKFVWFELTANLLDSNGRVLLPYTLSFREAHNTQEQAEYRAFHQAVIKINDEYRNLLNNITADASVQTVKQGSTIGIGINGDRDGIIQNAFTTVLSDTGLKNSGNNSDYLLNVTITVTPLAIPNNPMVFVQLELIANLLDSNGKVMLPYTISWRQGHINKAGAEERAFREAVTKINDEYRNLLNDIISR